MNLSKIEKCLIILKCYSLLFIVSYIFIAVSEFIPFFISTDLDGYIEDASGKTMLKISFIFLFLSIILTFLLVVAIAISLLAFINYLNKNTFNDELMKKHYKYFQTSLIALFSFMIYFLVLSSVYFGINYNYCFKGYYHDDLFIEIFFPWIFCVLGWGIYLPFALTFSSVINYFLFDISSILYGPKFENLSEETYEALKNFSNINNISVNYSKMYSQVFTLFSFWLLISMMIFTGTTYTTRTFYGSPGFLCYLVYIDQQNRNLMRTLINTKFNIDINDEKLINYKEKALRKNAYHFKKFCKRCHTLYLANKYPIQNN